MTRLVRTPVEYFVVASPSTVFWLQSQKRPNMPNLMQGTSGRLLKVSKHSSSVEGFVDTLDNVVD